MALSLNNLKPSKGAYKKRKRVGRGNASGHGTFSCRGMKGQRSRSGGKNKLKYKGMKMMLQRIPKKRGFNSPYPKAEVVNLKDLEKNFNDGETVNSRGLHKKGLIGTISKGVKVLGVGELKKKLIVENCELSAGARKAVEDAGGKIIVESVE